VLKIYLGAQGTFNRVYPMCLDLFLSCTGQNQVCIWSKHVYARRMGQPTQRATNYTARSNIDTAQIFLHANGQRPKRAMIRQRSRRRQRRGEPYTEHGLRVLLEIFRYIAITMPLTTVPVYAVWLSGGFFVSLHGDGLGIQMAHRGTDI